MSGHGGGGGKKKRRGGHAGGGGHGDARFLVTYADLLTVLMALFLVLWVLATIDLNKFKKFTQGLGDFGNPAAEVVETVEEASPGETVPEDGSPDETTPTAGDVTDTTDAINGTSGAPGSGGDGDNELTTGQLEGVAERLGGSLAAAGIAATASSVKVEARGLVVTIQTDGVLFPSGSATMTQGGKDILAVLAPELQGIANRIVIEGHTDKRPLARVGYDNWNLSADRAISVLRVMVNELGIPADRLAATGYGEFQPVDTADDEEALAKNRRVEIVVLAKATTPEPTTAPAAEGEATDGEATDEAATHEAATHEAAATDEAHAETATEATTTATTHGE